MSLPNIFGIVDQLSKLADDPNLTKAASALGETAVKIPELMQKISDALEVISGRLREQNVISVKIFREMERSNEALVAISLGLDNLTDPIKRPPFHVSDVEAMMSAQWPPYQEGIVPSRPGEGAPIDCTKLTIETKSEGNNGD